MPGMGSKRRKCSTCKKKVVNLRLHMRTHSQDRPFKCSFCNAAFKNNNNLSIHIRSIHTLEKPFKCNRNLCSASFSSMSALNTHWKHVHEKWQHDMPCVFCGKNFFPRHNEWRHLLAHIEEKPFSCEICGASFYAECQRELHVRTHLGESGYTCKHCKKSFFSQNKLQRHEERHAREGQCYDCSKCKAIFITEEGLKRHVSMVHKHVIRNYCCIFCQKWFRLKSDLFQHLLRHTNERPNSCHLCNAAFASSGDRNSHVRSCRSKLEKLQNNFRRS